LDDKRKEMPLGEGAVGIEFKDVDFTYPDRNVKVLNKLNIKVEPGQFAALVGASGCGKSTIISLIERFYDPVNGQILFGDTNILDVDAKSYRRNLSLVAQESTLYEGTIRDNVALSVEADEATDEAIEQACRSAQIHDFITSLSEGESFYTHLIQVLTSC
jgi:ABC-type multidrug transport system fused ATPase/permease subunit